MVSSPVVFLVDVLGVGDFNGKNFPLMEILISPEVSTMTFCIKIILASPVWVHRASWPALYVAYHHVRVTNFMHSVLKLFTSHESSPVAFRYLT